MKNIARKYVTVTLRNILNLCCALHPSLMLFGQVTPQWRNFGEIFVAFRTGKSFTIMHYFLVVIEWARVFGFIITILFLTPPPDSFMLSSPVGFKCALWTQHVSANITFILQFEVLVLDVVSQMRHSGCLKLTLRTWKYHALMPAFNMARKSVFNGEGAFTVVTFVTNSIMFCILMSSQVTRLSCSVGTLITREFGYIIFNCIVHVRKHIC